MANSTIKPITSNYQYSEVVTPATGTTLVNAHLDKFGRAVCVNAIITMSPTLNEWNDVCVLPEEYKPRFMLRINAINGTDDKSILGRIDQNGVFSIHPNTGDVTSPAINVILHASYIV